MKPARQKFDIRNSTQSIESLASAELLDWFVWDNLAMAAYERAGGDQAQAIDLLARAISRLSDSSAYESPIRQVAGPAVDFPTLPSRQRNGPARVLSTGMPD